MSESFFPATYRDGEHAPERKREGAEQMQWARSRTKALHTFYFVLRLDKASAVHKVGTHTHTHTHHITCTHVRILSHTHLHWYIKKSTTNLDGKQSQRTAKYHIPLYEYSLCDCIACTNVYVVCLYVYTCVNFRVNTSRDLLQLKTITDCRLTKLFIAVEAYERCRCPAEPRLIGEPSL